MNFFVKCERVFQSHTFYVMIIEDKEYVCPLYMQYKNPEFFHLSEQIFLYYALFISHFYFHKKHVVKICSNASIIMLKEGMDKKEKKANPKAHKRLIDKNVNEETVNYYVRIAATVDEGFEGDEDRGT